MMELKYDAEADAAYIKVSAGRIARALEESDVCILDLDSRGNLVGIELLSVFGFAGASLHALSRKGLIAPAVDESLLRELRSELHPRIAGPPAVTSQPSALNSHLTPRPLIRHYHHHINSGKHFVPLVPYVPLVPSPSIG